MANSVEFTETFSSSVTAATPPSPNTTMQQASVDQMMNVLDALLSHTHIFYDDYGTACNCNCNCNCNCTRGSL